MGDAGNYAVVSTTVGSISDADDLAEKIVAGKLAACVQSIKIKSTYRWSGKIEKSDEYLLLSKTRADLSDELCGFIKENHTYEIPEIIVTPVIGGSGPYLNWIDLETVRE